ncbi:hypothetical protein GRJ2_003320600 [Grus japonensis]|uniref:Uncharacterized protein n=1 Tax=Grus japonensis TaxID=30415 RepID=A0ABC9YG31_GRUJA
MPAGSKTGPPLAKAKPISASVITYLRSRKTLRERELLQPERGVRRCKKLCRHQVNEGSERAALVGTWSPARLNPPQSFLAPNVGHEKIEIRTVIGRAGEQQGRGSHTLVLKCITVWPWRTTSLPSCFRALHRLAFLEVSSLGLCRSPPSPVCV